MRDNMFLHLHLFHKEVEFGNIEGYDDILIHNYGALIKSVTRIVRSEIESPSILQNADFSSKTIKELIFQGELKQSKS
jgi:NTE family protein